MPNAKNGPLQTVFQVVAIVCSLAGLPAALYCAWITYSAHLRDGGAGTLIALDASSYLDLAFVVTLLASTLLFLGVLGSGVARIFRSTRAEEEPTPAVEVKPNEDRRESGTPEAAAAPEVPWKGYGSEPAWREATDEQNRLVDLGKKADGLFDPLQLEAFGLAKEMRDFVAASEPIPALDSNVPEQEKLRQINLRGEWREKLRNGYRLRFRDRQEKLFLKFGTRGVRADSATAASLPGRPPIEKQIPWEAAVLTAMAHRLDGIIVSGTPPE
jgi:hypothetical protein